MTYDQFVGLEMFLGSWVVILMGNYLVNKFWLSKIPPRKFPDGKGADKNGYCPGGENCKHGFWESFGTYS